MRVSELYGDIVHTTNVLARGECPYRVVKFERTELDEGLKASAVSDSSEDEELLQMLAKGTNPRQVDANAVRVDVVERAQLPAHTPAFRLASVSTVEHTVDSSVTEDTEMKKIVDFYYGLFIAQVPPKSNCFCFLLTPWPCGCFVPVANLINNIELHKQPKLDPPHYSFNNTRFGGSLE